MIKVYEVSRKYIMLFTHNNRYLPLTGLLTLLQWTIQPAPIVHREIFKIFQKYFTKYFMKYFTTKEFMKFYITTHSALKSVNIWRRRRGIFNCLTGGVCASPVEKLPHQCSKLAPYFQTIRLTPRTTEGTLHSYVLHVVFMWCWPDTYYSRKSVESCSKQHGFVCHYL